VLIAAYILGALTVISSFGVVSARKPLNSALWLVVTLFLVAAHFALLEAHFLAATQILIYAGAIMVLVIFVIMLLGLEEDPSERVFSSPSHVAIGVICLLFVAALVSVFSREILGLTTGLAPASPVAELGTTEQVGEALMTKFALPLQIIGLMLLAATIGAVVLAFEKKRPLAKGRGLQAVHREPDEASKTAANE